MGRELRRYALVKGETTIGRDPTNDVVIDNLGVSRTHAAVVRAGGEFIARDLGGKNGLFVNGMPTAAQQLRHGDSIQIGKFSLTLSTLGDRCIVSAEETSLFDENDRARVLDAVASARHAAPSDPPSALSPAPAQPNRVALLEHQVRSLRRALYASLALVILMAVELVAIISKFPRH
jgi:pSer/pThr/pTyr-binding forkhead associated (FHA) protein